MSKFEYEALDGQGREVKDEIEALKLKEAISKIRDMGYFPTKVRAKSKTKVETESLIHKILTLFLK